MADLLIVDDDEPTGDLLADLLREQGHEVRVARNGGDGLAQLKMRRPDLVLLDVEMPVMTGPEMSGAMLLHDLGLERVPVVLLSGLLDLGTVAGAVGTPYYLTKPCDIELLLSLVGRALAERLAPVPGRGAAS